MTKKQMTISMIAAIAHENIIGDGPDIPWHLPSDFAHFKRTTMGKPLVMGRKTFESIGKPLPGRTTIVVSRQEGYQPEGVIVINDLAAAIDHAKTIALADKVDEVFIAGGAEIYRQAMAKADRLIISHVDARPDGDAYFPQILPSDWQIVAKPDTVVSEKDSTTYKICIYTRPEGAAH